MVAEPRDHRVPPEGKGARVDAYLASVYPDLSRARVQALLLEEHVTVDGVAAKASRRLRGGEQLRVLLPPIQPALALPEDLPLAILYEDKDIIVVDKAAGVVVHPAAGHPSGTLVNALLYRLPSLDVGGHARPGIVHRLDRGTSGCLVAAKTTAALKSLQSQFKSRVVQKTYLALVHGAPPEAWRIETAYGRHPVHRKKFTGRLKDGKPAVTVCRTVERFGDAALLEVQLLTGRTHQIRVHLSEAGFPIIGDPLYGRSRVGRGAQAVEQKLDRQALHAWRLGFQHPRTRKKLSFEAPIPADLERVLRALRAR